MRILPADEQAAVKNAGGFRAWLSGIVQARHNHTINWDKTDTTAPPLRARISRGDWVVSCDLLAGTQYACGGSMVATYNDPVYFCDECCNSEYDNKVRMVEFPPEKNRLIIEELLIARPHPGLRNYSPDDTIIDIRNANTSEYWLNV